MGRSSKMLLALFVLGTAVAAPASAGNGIQMRHVRGACDGYCVGDRSPTWSPDGRTIAFGRRALPERRGSLLQTIFTIRSTGGAPRRVVAPARQFVPRRLAWSPDSRRIAFEANAVNYVVPAAGGEPVRVQPGSTTGQAHGFDDGPSAWSPDGTRIAFVRFGEDQRRPPVRGWCCQVWTAAPDGSGESVVGGGPPPAEWLREPAWVSEGRLAYVTGPRNPSGSPDLSRAEIWISNADGRARRRLVGDTSDGGFHHLVWHRNESRLYYVAEVAGAKELRWVGGDGDSFTFARLPARPDVVCCEFAPTPTAAAYMRPGADGAMEIRVVRPGGADRLIADGVSSQSRPRLTTVSWAPNGEEIAYLSDGECPTVLAVHTVTLVTREARRVTRPCRIAGDRRANVLRGTKHVDALYGRGGNDTLRGLAKPDFLQGGPGRDHVFGGMGDDRLYGGPGGDDLNAGEGWDAVYAHDGARDVVRCGSGTDRVRADRRDVVGRDCEVVETS